MSPATTGDEPPGTSLERSTTLWSDTAGAVPGLARISATAALRATVWGVGSGVRSGRLVVRAMTRPATAGELVEEVARDVALASRTVSDVARAVGSGVPVSRALLDATRTLSSVVLPDSEPSSGSPGSGTSSASGSGSTGNEREEAEQSLRERGHELLRRSRDVWSEDEAHPAYARILDDLAPDEARILLLLMEGGPQPSVDVRTGGPVGMVSSTLVSPGLSMIGPRAGCRYLDEVPAYLNNLQRLGLIWFSREQLEDPMEYQVVEAQPDVLDAMHSVRFPKVVRRSIHLTPFGVNFCRACLVDPEDDEALPVHQIPDE